jgi:NADH:ubiquinone oxidoreductase subunit E
LLTVQEALGHVPLDGLNEISCALGVTEADVAGVLSYYPDLRTRPSGRHLIRVCMGESCMANHCGRVLREFQDHLRIGVGDTAPGGRFRLEHVYCLGNCAVSPTVVVDGELYGRVTPSQIGTLLERYK